MIFKRLIKMSLSFLILSFISISSYATPHGLQCSIESSQLNSEYEIYLAGMINYINDGNAYMVWQVPTSSTQNYTIGPYEIHNSSWMTAEAVALKVFGIATGSKTGTENVSSGMAMIGLAEAISQIGFWSSKITNFAIAIFNLKFHTEEDTSAVQYQISSAINNAVTSGPLFQSHNDGTVLCVFFYGIKDGSTYSNTGVVYNKYHKDASGAGSINYDETLFGGNFSSYGSNESDYSKEDGNMNQLANGTNSVSGTNWYKTITITP